MWLECLRSLQLEPLDVTSLRMQTHVYNRNTTREDHIWSCAHTTSNASLMIAQG